MPKFTLVFLTQTYLWSQISGNIPEILVKEMILHCNLNVSVHLCVLAIVAYPTDTPASDLGVMARYRTCPCELLYINFKSKEQNLMILWIMSG